MNELQRTNETHFFIKEITSHFILEKGTEFVVGLRDRWRDIYSERGLLLAPYLLPEAMGCQRLNPLVRRIVRDVRDAIDRLRIPWLVSRFWLAYLNLTTWFSYHVVSFRLHTCSTGLPRRTAIPLFSNHNVTACQNTRVHQKRTQNPCQRSLYNTFGEEVLCFWLQQSIPTPADRMLLFTEF